MKRVEHLNIEIDDNEDSILDSSEELPLKNLLYECLNLQVYGHKKFTDKVEQPIDISVVENAIENMSPNDNLKKHPIAESVYFSGIADAYNLPHTSKEAMLKNLEYKLQLKKSLDLKFNPKPTI